MKRIVMLLTVSVIISTAMATAENKNYRGNRAPLVQKPFIELPIGAIKADGWLLEMLKRQATGSTALLSGILERAERNPGGRNNPDTLRLHNTAYIAISNARQIISDHGLADSAQKK